MWSAWLDQQFIRMPSRTLSMGEIHRNRTGNELKILSLLRHSIWCARLQSGGSCIWYGIHCYARDVHERFGNGFAEKTRIGRPLKLISFGVWLQIPFGYLCHGHSVTNGICANATGGEIRGAASAAVRIHGSVFQDWCRRRPAQGGVLT
jgi:hypothetical protein